MKSNKRGDPKGLASSVSNRSDLNVEAAVETRMAHFNDLKELVGGDAIPRELMSEAMRVSKMIANEMPVNTIHGMQKRAPANAKAALLMQGLAVSCKSAAVLTTGTSACVLFSVLGEFGQGISDAFSVEVTRVVDDPVFKKSVMDAMKASLLTGNTAGFTQCNPNFKQAEAWYGINKG